MLGSILKYIFLAALSLICINNVVSAEYVPVYIWGQSTSSEPVPALSHISKDLFKEIMLQRLNKKSTLVVFAEKTLSPEDFTLKDISGNNVLPKLSKTSASSNYWSSVQNPMHFLLHLPKVKSKEFTIEKDNDVDELLQNLKTMDTQVIIINLNDAREDEDRILMLQRHDDIIHKIYSQLSEQNNEILAIYTSKHSSWIIPQEVHHRQLRHLLAEESNVTEAMLFNTTNVLMYVSSAPIFKNLTNNETLNDLMSNSTISDNDIILTLSNGKISIEMFIIFQADNYWYLQNMTVEYNGNKENVKAKQIYAPIGFSYHCSNSLYFGEYGTMNISFPGMQIQPVNNSISAFGDAYDCVGFTSAPIWSGLFVTFILVLILTLGISMMMDIKTMDRFDDPKGKTITIIASE